MLQLTQTALHFSKDKILGRGMATGNVAVESDRVHESGWEINNPCLVIDATRDARDTASSAGNGGLSFVNVTSLVTLHAHLHQ
jgi:hypothetical protein